MPDPIALAEALRSCPSVGGRVQVPIALARQIVEALRDAGEFVRVGRIGE